MGDWCGRWRSGAAGLTKPHTERLCSSASQFLSAFSLLDLLSFSLSQCFQPTQPLVFQVAKNHYTDSLSQQRSPVLKFWRAAAGAGELVSDTDTAFGTRRNNQPASKRGSNRKTSPKHTSKSNNYSLGEPAIGIRNSSEAEAEQANNRGRSPTIHEEPVDNIERYSVLKRLAQRSGRFGSAPNQDGGFAQRSKSRGSPGRAQDLLLRARDPSSGNIYIIVYLSGRSRGCISGLSCAIPNAW